MAGMLPGVECARRRRFHLSSDNSPSAAVSGGGSTRRTSFCLYTSNHEISHTSVSSLRIVKKENGGNEKLEATAQQAKERLDVRLKTQQRKSSGGSKGEGCGDGMGRSRNRTIKERGSKKKLINWAKMMSWKASEQDECSICLERFNAGETLVHLPCAHRYHSKCLVPWLENNAHCPCCRMELCVSFS